MAVVDRRFQLGFFEERTDDPGLVLNDEGDVLLVTPAGERVPLGGDGSMQFLEFSLSAADIAAAGNGVPTLLLAAPSGKCIVAIRSVLFFKFGFVTYGPQDSAAIEMGWKGAHGDDDDVFISAAAGRIRIGGVDSYYQIGNAGAGDEIASVLDYGIWYQASALIGSIVAAEVDGGGGENYAVGDTGTIDAGDNLATYEVLSVDGDGAVVTFAVTNPGAEYDRDNAQTTADGAQPGIGTGFSVLITEVDPQGDGTVSGTIYYALADLPPPA